MDPWRPAAAVRPVRRRRAGGRGHDPTPGLPPPASGQHAGSPSGDPGRDPGRSRRQPPRCRRRLAAWCGQVHPGRAPPRRGLASAGERVMVIAQTNEQVDDLTERLADDQPGPADRPCLRTGLRAIRPHRPAPAGDGVRERRRPGRLPGRGRNRAQMGDGRRHVRGRGRSWTRPTRCARTCCCASPACSSAPCSSATPASSTRSRTVQTERWTGLTWDPMQSAVAVLLRHNPDIPVHRLPVSWRLPEPAADVVVRGVLPLHRVPGRHGAGAAAYGVHHRLVR